MMWMRFPARNASTVALDAKEQKEEEEKKVGTGSVGGVVGGAGDGKAIMSYWGVSPGKVTKEDGTEWRWSCFRVREIYDYEKKSFPIDLKHSWAHMLVYSRKEFNR